MEQEILATTLSPNQLSPAIGALPVRPRDLQAMQVNEMDHGSPAPPDDSLPQRDITDSFPPSSDTFRPSINDFPTQDVRQVENDDVIMHELPAIVDDVALGSEIAGDVTGVSQLDS